jgi:hypothetical protein
VDLRFNPAELEFREPPSAAPEGPFDVPPTVPAAVRRAARLWPDEEAVVDGG